MTVETSAVKVYHISQQQNYQNFFEEGRKHHSYRNLNINFSHLKTYNLVIVLC